MLIVVCGEVLGSMGCLLLVVDCCLQRDEKQVHQIKLSIYHTNGEANYKGGDDCHHFVSSNAVFNSDKDDLTDSGFSFVLYACGSISSVSSGLMSHGYYSGTVGWVTRHVTAMTMMTARRRRRRITMTAHTQ
eukprot:6266329-Ditylum_brightwellii.AAC.1